MPNPTPSTNPHRRLWPQPISRFLLSNLLLFSISQTTPSQSASPKTASSPPLAASNASPNAPTDSPIFTTPKKPDLPPAPPSAPVSSPASPGKRNERPPSPAFPRFTLTLDHVWWLNPTPPQPFDASGLARLPDGSFLIVNDKSPELFQVRLPEDAQSADLVSADRNPAPSALAELRRASGGNPDFEGIALDLSGPSPEGYVPGEARRTVYRFRFDQRSVEPLAVDWSPVEKYFSRSDSNASFEGIALSPTHLYVANERDVGRILVLARNTWKVIDSFQVQPAGQNARDVQYADLAWWGDHLWVLCRQSRCILEVDPATHKVLAQFDYGRIESNRAYAYSHPYPFGFMEGLAVDDSFFWLLVDNNGFARVADKTDKRPVLFRCRRPDRNSSKPSAAE